MEYAILFLPLIGSLIGYLGRSLTHYFAEISTSLFVSISAILSIVVFWNGIQNEVYGNYIIFEWISSGGFNANCSSALVKTGIGATKKNKDLMNSNNLSEIPNFIIPAFSF